MNQEIDYKINHIYNLNSETFTWKIIIVKEDNSGVKYSLLNEYCMHGTEAMTWYMRDIEIFYHVFPMGTISDYPELML